MSMDIAVMTLPLCIALGGIGILLWLIHGKKKHKSFGELSPTSPYFWGSILLFFFTCPGLFSIPFFLEERAMQSDLLERGFKNVEIKDLDEDIAIIDGKYECTLQKNDKYGWYLKWQLCEKISKPKKPSRPGDDRTEFQKRMESLNK